MVVGDVWRMLRLLGPFLVSCLVLELWADNAASQTYTTDYVYTTPCGWMLVSVDLLFLGLYVSSLRRTLASEGSQEDRQFYRTWGFAYALWFLALPVVALLARIALAPYAWFLVSMAVKKGCTAVVYASLVAGFWPECPTSQECMSRARDVASRFIAMAAETMKFHIQLYMPSSQSGSTSGTLAQVLPVHRDGTGPSVQRPVSPKLPGLLFHGKSQFKQPQVNQKLVKAPA